MKQNELKKYKNENEINDIEEHFELMKYHCSFDPKIIQFNPMIIDQNERK